MVEEDERRQGKRQEKRKKLDGNLMYSMWFIEPFRKMEKEGVKVTTQ